jgi:hypothetical protein
VATKKSKVDYAVIHHLYEKRKDLEVTKAVKNANKGASASEIAVLERWADRALKTELGF